MGEHHAHASVGLGSRVGARRSVTKAEPKAVRKRDRTREDKASCLEPRARQTISLAPGFREIRAIKVVKSVEEWKHEEGDTIRMPLGRTKGVFPKTAHLARTI
jgi:hypothetical protein